ncbi:hypothetical protein DPMN_156876 [Dreissena polymorpha]|uniref:Uncharacterized protein n=1 Tax=Dreissena polymorpha TaxID=45954 RepID=A0A9D4FV19_DREPO|nr:hypothetical protein DPMN_156876 [Dreissena polymorpha]
MGNSDLEVCRNFPSESHHHLRTHHRMNEPIMGDFLVRFSSLVILLASLQGSRPRPHHRQLEKLRLKSCLNQCGRSQTKLHQFRNPFPNPAQVPQAFLRLCHHGRRVELCQLLLFPDCLTPVNSTKPSKTQSKYSQRRLQYP